LARAAYGKPDLILLDDPLSALDAGTAKLVFKDLIKGPDAFLSDSAVILVTHASHFLNRVDRIAIIVEGQNKFFGTWNELLVFEATDLSTKTAVGHIRESIQEDHHQESMDEEIDKQSGPGEEVMKEALMTKEEREHGISSWTTWYLWFKYAGGLYFISIMVALLTLDRILYFGQEYWVARWTDGAYESITVFGIHFPPQTDGRSAQYMYLAAYAVILAAALIANLARSEWSVTGGSRAARNVFQAMLSRVLRAPMWYFETNPMGRLLNRFTYDMEIVDFVLSQNMALLLVATSSYVSGITVMIGIMPLVALSVIPVTVVYVFLLWFYRRTGTDLQRLDALSRSPIQAMITEGMDGVTTIRVLKQESVFLDKYHLVVDKSTASLLNFVSAQRWLGCRIEMMGALTVFIPALLVSCWNDHLRLSSGLVGLLIVGSLNFTLALSFLVDFFAEAESAITAIERVDAMSKVPQEKPNETDPKLALDPAWPSSGKLQFENVCMRYRTGLPLALDGLSFEIPAGKTCGVVGRTGAVSSCSSIR
jgi:ABC-type multidrug transport system fused ATPase/permease subunit